MLKRAQCVSFARDFLPVLSLVQSLSFRFVSQTWNGGVVGDLIVVRCKVGGGGWEEMLVRVSVGRENENLLAGLYPHYDTGKVPLPCAQPRSTFPAPCPSVRREETRMSE